MHETFLRQQIDGIMPNGFAALERIHDLPDEVAADIGSAILGFACQAQNDAAIRAGRRAFARIPGHWLCTKLRQIVDRSLNLSDEWEYRRLLELLAGAMRSAVPYYVALGLRSSNPEVVEAAADFASRE